MNTCTDTAPVLAAALALTRAGTRVVPVKRGQKAPCLPKWQDLRLDEGALGAHFSQFVNIGVLLGTPSGGLVDVDIDHPLFKQFIDWLPATNRIHGRSANPASHRWYRVVGPAPESVRLKTPAGQTIVELRSTGGQTVVPPSVYIDRDGSVDNLQWESEGEPGAVAAEKLLESLRRASAATLLALHWPASGGRHDAGLALAGALLRHGWSVVDAEDFIRRVAEAASDDEANDRAACVASTAGRLQLGQTVKGIPSLKQLMSADAVDRVAEWLQLGRGPIESGEWGEPVLVREPLLPDIPADLLPSPYREFARALAQSTEVPEALCVLTILAIVATASAKKYCVVPRSDWCEPVNLYILIALPPANNKSQILRRCLSPILFWEFQSGQQVEPLRLQALSDKRNHEARIQALRGKMARATDPAAIGLLKIEIINEEHLLHRLVVPAMPKLFVNDVTPESLALHLVEQAGRLAVISDEGGFFETIAGLYTGGKANNDIVLKGIDGGDVRIERKERSLQVRPFLTIAIVAQPQVLKNMGERKALQGKGIPERFIYAIPPSRLGRRQLQTTPVPPHLDQAFDSAVRQLLDVDVLTDDLGFHHPRQLPLSKDAAALWNNWRHEIEPKLGPAGELAPCLGWGGKLAGCTLRIAGLLELMATGPGATAVGSSSMADAIAMARLLIQHALAAFGLMAENPAQELAERVIGKLRQLRQPSVSKTELYRALHGGMPDVQKLNAALQFLEDREVIRGRDVHTTPGKRTTRVFDVNPALIA